MTKNKSATPAFDKAAQNAADLMRKNALHDVILTLYLIALELRDKKDHPHLLTFRDVATLKNIRGEDFNARFLNPLGTYSVLNGYVRSDETDLEKYVMEVLGHSAELHEARLSDQSPKILQISDVSAAPAQRLDSLHRIIARNTSEIVDFVQTQFETRALSTLQEMLKVSKIIEYPPAAGRNEYSMFVDHLTGRDAYSARKVIANFKPLAEVLLRKFESDKLPEMVAGDRAQPAEGIPSAEGDMWSRLVSIRLHNVKKHIYTPPSGRHARDARALN